MKQHEKIKINARPLHKDGAVQEFIGLRPSAPKI